MLLAGSALAVTAVSVWPEDLPRSKGALDPRPASKVEAGAPVNLRVLPKDTSAAEVKDLMEQYSDELGVECEYCHTRNQTTRQLDYVSDDNPAKQTARVMMTMLNEINGKFLAQLDDQKYAVLVSCGNCHRGHTDPPEFVPGPLPAAKVEGAGK